MVQWVNAQNFGSGIADALSSLGAKLYGDTLTPELKRQQLLRLQREETGVQNLMDLTRTMGRGPTGPEFNAGGTGRPGAPADTVFAAPPSVENIYTGNGGLSFGLPPAPTGPRMPGSPALSFNGLAAPADPEWEAIRSGIFAGESGGDYDALFGFSNRDGGRYSNVRMTDMTAAEALDFANPSGDYGQWVKDQVGRVSTPMGGYQVVGTTLRDAIEAGVVQPGERMTPEVQDRLGRWIYETQGTGAWEGYRGPGDPGAFTPADPYADVRLPSPETAYPMYDPQFLPGALPSPLTGAPSQDPGQYNPNSPQILAEMQARALEAGLTPAEAADYARMATANLYGAENQATTNAFVGAGGNYGSTYSGFAADQNRMERSSVRDDSTVRFGDIIQSADRQRGQDIDFSRAIALDEADTVDVVRDGVPIKIRKSDMLPGDQPVLSSTEVQGLTARNLDLTPEQQLAYIGAEPKNPPTADAYVSGDGKVYRSIDGVNDVNGVPLPSDAIKTGVMSADRGSAGLAAPVTTGVQNNIIGLDNISTMLGEARAVAEADPTLFGIVGRGRELGQNLMQQWAQFQRVAPKQAAALRSQNDTMLDTITSIEDPDGLVAAFLSTEYDPNLSTLDLYGALLPYAAASALAQQEGRGLSDRDVQAFRGIVGDPTSLWSTQAGFLNRLDTIQRIVDARILRAQETLDGGTNALVPSPGAAAPPPPTGDVPQITGNVPRITGDADYEALPSGAEFISPDGSLRRKP